MNSLLVVISIFSAIFGIMYIFYPQKRYSEKEPFRCCYNIGTVLF